MAQSQGLPFILGDAQGPIAEANQFLQSLYLRNVAPQTIRAYAYDLRAFYVFLAEKGLKPQNIQREHIFEFVAWLQSQDASPRTMNRRLVSVRCFLNHVYPNHGNLWVKAPAFYRGAKNKALLGASRRKQTGKHFSLKVPKTLLRVLEPPQVQKLFEVVTRFRDRAIVCLMLCCGLRSCEVLRLLCTDINLKQRQLLVRGKGQKQRLLPLSDLASQALRDYLEYERPDGQHPHCFVSLKGPSRRQPLKPAALRKLFRSLRKKVGIPHLHAHMLRHSFCTHLIAQGVSLPVVQKLMGHSDIEVTMLYAHLSPVVIHDDYQQAQSRIETHYAQ